jgi:hypothetical protein
MHTFDPEFHVHGNWQAQVPGVPVQAKFAILGSQLIGGEASELQTAVSRPSL